MWRTAWRWPSNRLASYRRLPVQTRSPHTKSIKSIVRVEMTTSDGEVRVIVADDLVTYLTAATIRARCAENVTNKATLSRCVKESQLSQNLKYLVRRWSMLRQDDSINGDDEQVAFAIRTVIKEPASRIMLEPICQWNWTLVPQFQLSPKPR